MPLISSSVMRYEVKSKMMDKLIELGSSIAPWFFDRTKRYRMRGARIQVIAFVVCREPEHAVLLGQSPYHGIWMPPQEGVDIKEGLKDALLRCLEVECGLDLPSEERTLKRTFHCRGFRYVGSIDLPRGRRGERPVADDAVGTALEGVVLKRKAYWMATVIIGSRDAITPKADGKELLDLRWFPLSHARQAILETNHPEKASLLDKCLDWCKRDLEGATKTW